MTPQPFGLRDDPFAEGQDRRLVYPHRTHRECVDRLARAITQRAPLVLLTGPAGSGKTTSLASVLMAAGRITRIDLPTSATLEASEVERRVGEALDSDGVPADDRLVARLSARDPHAPPLVLAIDEAQELTDVVLDELRDLTGAASGGHAALTVVLAGRAPIEARLDAHPGLGPRLTARGKLEPMSPRETEAFIHHRVSVSGGPGAVFPRATCRAIHEHSRGIARGVRVLAGEALTQASVAGAKAVELAHVTAAVAKLDSGKASAGARESRKAPPAPSAESKAAAPTAEPKPAAAERKPAEPKPAAAPPSPTPAPAQQQAPAPAPAPVAAAPAAAPAKLAPTPAEDAVREPKKAAPAPAQAPPPPPAKPAPSPAQAKPGHARPAPAPALALAKAPAPAESGPAAAEPKPAPMAAPPEGPVPALTPEEATYTSPPVAHTPAIDAWLSRFNDPAGPPRIGSRVAVDDSTTELAHPTPIDSHGAEGAEGEAGPPPPRVRPRRGRVVGRGPLKPSRYARRPSTIGWLVGAAAVFAIVSVVWLHRSSVLSQLARFEYRGAPETTTSATPVPPAPELPQTATPTPEPAPPPEVTTRDAVKTSRVRVTPIPAVRPSARSEEPAVPYSPATPESTPTETTSSDTTPQSAGEASTKIAHPYRVIVGSYLVSDRAHEERDRVAGLTPFPCKVLKGREDGADVFRVLVGPFATRGEAEAASEQLSATGSVNEARVVGWFGPKAPRE